jgi:hypothetical protein
MASFDRRFMEALGKSIGVIGASEVGDKVRVPRSGPWAPVRARSAGGRRGAASPPTVQLPRPPPPPPAPGQTFFIAAIMAMRHPRLTVFGGAITALAVMTVLAVALGWAAPALVGAGVLRAGRAAALQRRRRQQTAAHDGSGSAAARRRDLAAADRFAAAVMHHPPHLRPSPPSSAPPPPPPSHHTP